VSSPACCAFHRPPNPPFVGDGAARSRYGRAKPDGQASSGSTEKRCMDRKVPGVKLNNTINPQKPAIFNNKIFLPKLITFTGAQMSVHLFIVYF
jgi:hypothetical protein